MNPVRLGIDEVIEILERQYIDSGEPIDLIVSDLDDEKEILEKFVRECPVNDKIFTCAFESKFEKDGCFIVHQVGASLAVKFEWIFH